MRNIWVLMVLLLVVGCDLPSSPARASDISENWAWLMEYASMRPTEEELEAGIEEPVSVFCHTFLRYMVAQEVWEQASHYGLKDLDRLGIDRERLDSIRQETLSDYRALLLGVLYGSARDAFCSRGGLEYKVPDRFDLLADLLRMDIHPGKASREEIRKAMIGELKQDIERWRELGRELAEADDLEPRELLRKEGLWYDLRGLIRHRVMGHDFGPGELGITLPEAEELGLVPPTETQEGNDARVVSLRQYLSKKWINWLERSGKSGIIEVNDSPARQFG